MNFRNFLRWTVGLKPEEEAPKKARPKEPAGPGELKELCAKYLACQDVKEKAAVMEQMYKVLPKTLFLATMCYAGESAADTVAGRDRELHATVGAKRLYELNQATVTRGNPGYRLSKKADNRRIHLHTLVSNKTKETWVPLFTDFTNLLPVFGQQYRVTLISFEEAKTMARHYNGIVLNPGKTPVYLTQNMLKDIR